MKKRFFILALVALVLTLLPATALADGDVCQIGETGYTSLLSAIYAAQDGDTIMLLTDTSVDQPVPILAKSITINLNDHTAAIGPTTQYVLDVEQGGALLLEGEGALNIVSTSGSGYPAVYATQGSSVQVTNITSSNGGVGIATDGSGSSVEVFGSVAASGTDSVGVRASNGASITVHGSVMAQGTNSIGVHLYTGGEVTIDGSLAGTNYVTLNGFNRTKTDMTIPTTKPGYNTYTDGTCTAWTRPDFKIAGNADGYVYEGGILTFTSGGNYTVSMLEGVTQTTTDIIAVESGLDGVNITLDGVDIDVSATAGACAFDIGAGSSVNLTLTGDSSLKSGMGQAGLHVPPGASLTIDGTGSLTAAGKGDISGNTAKGGAGIGGDGNVGYMSGETSGSITILGGTITANGGSGYEIVGSTGYSYGGAGIGGGGGAGGIVTISGGIVTAIGGDYSAGIGGGVTDLDGTNIVNISGGTVTATGGVRGGAGIGGTFGRRCGSVTISGSTVIARGGNGDGIGYYGGAGIGNGGYNTNACTLTITGGSVNMTDGAYYSGGTRSIVDSSSRPLYLTTIGLQVDPDTLVDLLTIALDGAPYNYGITDMYTDGSCALYLYLPNRAATSLVETASNCFIGNDGIDDPIVTDGATTGSLYTAYAVRFDTGAGSPVPSKYYRIGHGGFISRPVTNPEREHYDFYNWYTEPECATLFDFENTLVTGPTIIYAKWYPHPYIINYDLAGGVNTPENPDIYTIESDDISLVAPTRAGYDFAGWSGTDVTGVKRSVTISKGSSGEREYTAHWNATGTRVVTFDSQGGTPATLKKTVKVNSLVAVPTAPVKSGYYLKGWLKDAPNGTVLWNFSKDKVTDNLTLWAKWAPRTYTVTFNSRGGSAVRYASVVYNTLVTQPANPTRYGYGFDKWYKESACVNAWAFDTDHMPAKNITLYAKWNIHQWNVTFDAKGGEFEPGVTTLVRNDVAYYSLIPAPLIPTRAHYTFKGWYNASNNKAWIFTKYRTPDRDLTLYVKWQPDAFKITFNSQGGTKVYSKTGYWGLTLTVPKAPSRTGYIFGGWFKDAACTDDWVFGTGGDVVAGAATLYAKWTPKICTVTFNANGGTIGGNPTYSETKNYGETIFRPTMPLEKGVYYFGGWYTSKYFTTQWKFSSKVTKSMTLYAKWMASKYKITFKANASGVTNLPAPIYAECYEMPLEPPQPAKTGYTFIGWYRSSTHFTDANRFYFGGSFVTGSVTLYAKWVPSQYKVTFNATGGTPTPPAQTVNWGQLAAEPAEPAKSGYFFGGWYRSSTNFMYGNLWDFDHMGVTKNMTLYARWVKTLSTPKVTAVAENVTAIMLRCSTVPFAKYYKFEYAASALGPWTPLYDGEFSEIGAGDMDINTIYYFRAKAYCVVDGVTYSSGYSPVVPETPDKPGSVTATAASYNKIHVAWSDSGIYRNTGYEVWRATSLKGTYTKLGTTASSVLSFDNTVYTGKKYYYKVRAYRYVGTKVYGAFSDIVSKNTILDTPGSFIAGGSGLASATALWNAVQGASGYELWRATADTGVFKLLKRTTALSYKNTGLVTDQPYYYKVRAYRYVSGRRVYSAFTEVKIATPSDF